MHIVFMHERLGRSRGGVEAWIYHATETCLKLGHRVDVLTAESRAPADAAPSGARVHAVPSPLHVPGLGPFVDARAISCRIRSLMRGADRVIARSPVMALAAILAGRKDVVMIHAQPQAESDMVSMARRHRGWHRPLRVLCASCRQWSIALIERRVIRSSCNVFLSHARRREYEQMYGAVGGQASWYVIPPGVDVERFVPAGEEWTGRGPLRLFSACRLVESKNLQCAIRAMGRMLHEGVNVLFHIAGEGPYRMTLEALCREVGLTPGREVVFVGEQINIEDFYTKSHVFVLPTLYEGFGSVFIEAMACGLPCVALSRHAGDYSVASDEIISHGQDGILLKENSPQALAEALMQIHSDPRAWARMSLEARRKAKEAYSWPVAIGKILALGGWPARVGIDPDAEE